MWLCTQPGKNQGADSFKDSVVRTDEHNRYCRERGMISKCKAEELQVHVHMCQRSLWKAGVAARPPKIEAYISVSCLSAKNSRPGV